MNLYSIQDCNGVWHMIEANMFNINEANGHVIFQRLPDYEKVAAFASWLSITLEDPEEDA